MHYFLNGGRDERAVLKYRPVQELYSQLGVTKILFIVYAIREEFWQQLWHRERDMFGMPNFEVRALTIYDENMTVIKDAVAWADFVYLPGGSQETLLKRMDQFGTSQTLADAITAGKLKLLGGGSAGAMVMGAQCLVGHEELKKVVPGLGFVADHVIDSHFSNRGREPRMHIALQNHPDLTGMGIDEDTGVMLDDNLALQAVYGPGTVSVYHANQKETYDSSSFNNT